MLIIRVLEIPMLCNFILFRKNMTCLNDINEEIVRKEYIIDLLLLLNDQDQISFYGFYVRYINFSLKYYKLENKVDNNFDKLISIVYKMKWLPSYFKRFTDIINKLDQVNFEKVINHICNYLTEFNPFLRKDEINSDLENKKGYYRIQTKILLIDNINLI
jgi:hypothetical protein